MPIDLNNLFPGNSLGYHLAKQLGAKNLDELPGKKTCFPEIRVSDTEVVILNPKLKAEADTIRALVENGAPIEAAVSKVVPEADIETCNTLTFAVCLQINANKYGERYLQTFQEPFPARAERAIRFIYHIMNGNQLHDWVTDVYGTPTAPKLPPELIAEMGFRSKHGSHEDRGMIRELRMTINQAQIVAQQIIANREKQGKEKTTPC